MTSGGIGAAVLGACLVALPGCDIEVPAPSPGLGTSTLVPLRLVEATTTVAYADGGRPVHGVLDEQSLTQGVRQSASFTLAFDRFLLPEVIIRQAICLRASVESVDTLAECTGPSQHFTEPAYDPLARTVTFRLRPGTALEASTVYRLTVFQPVDGNDDRRFGFRAFDRAPLDRKYALTFQTAPPGDDAHEEPSPSLERYCQAIDCVADCRANPANAGDPAAEQTCIQTHCSCLDEACFNDGWVVAEGAGVLASACTSSGCHGGASAGGAAAEMAAMGLDLSSPEAIEQTALGQVAHQTEAGESAAIAETSPVRFGRSMPVLGPFNPGQSYLLYKLAINPLNYPLGDARFEPELAAEVERLRDAVVVGLPMPPLGSLVDRDSDPSGELSWERAQLLSSWIAHGAPLRCE